MTIAELMKELSELPDDTLVVLSKDAEGNRFSPLDAIRVTQYVAETTYSGDIVDVDDEVPGAVKAAVLWPVN